MLRGLRAERIVSSHADRQSSIRPALVLLPSALMDDFELTDVTWLR